MGCYDLRCDVWSAGVTVYSFFCCNLPFVGKSLRDLEKCIITGNFSFPSKFGFDNVTEEAKSFIRTCLKFDPDERYTAVQASQDTWLSKGLYAAGGQAVAPPPAAAQGGYSHGPE